ncbi:helix-turn-helix domain-containing protein [Nostoc sp.]|uniref:helix-turn-helix domain-containing protein n=1 Tax=Nostoc sp. TaxID=1180 RepID=UPI002FF8F9AB
MICDRTGYAMSYTEIIAHNDHVDQFNQVCQDSSGNFGNTKVSRTFGHIIRTARKEKELSQREMAKLIGVDYTYLSKLENDHAGYPPSEDVIHKLALHLNLNEEELRHLAGRITPDDTKVFEDLVKKYKQMPALLRRMRDEPDFAHKLLRETTKSEGEEK